MGNSFIDNTMTTISDATIEKITTNNNNTFVTVAYETCENCNRINQTVRLVVSNNTLIFDEFGNMIPVSDLSTGMTINATISSSMTRSIPPQAAAFMIRVVRKPVSDTVTTGRIIDINRDSRHFTTLSDNNLSSTIRFNLARNTRFFDIFGRPMDFSGLRPGMRVRVRHASFMTASIPPQTTAYEVRVVR